MNKPEYKPEVITLFEQKQKEIGLSVIEKPGTVEYKREAYRYLIENALIPPTTENVALALTGKNTIVLSITAADNTEADWVRDRIRNVIPQNVPEVTTIDNED
jgi:hypothetical protein